MTQLRISFFLFVMLFTNAIFCEESDYYLVLKDDNLTTILHKLNLYPIYGNTGSLKIAMQMNPWLQMKKGRLIYRGQKIILPFKHVVEVSRSVATEDVAKVEEVAEVNTVIESPAPPQNIIPPEPEIVAPLAESPVPLEDEVQQSKIMIATGYDYFRIDAVDKLTKDKAALISNSSPHVNLNWELLWDKDWSTEFALVYRQENIVTDAHSTKSLSKKSYSRINSYFGLNRIWSDRNKTQILVGRTQRGFLRSESTTEIKIDPVTSTDFGVKHESIIFKKKKASAGVEGLVSYLGSASAPGYSVDPGHLFRGSIFVRHQLKTFLIEARGSYTTWEQDSKYVSQKAKEVGTSFAIGWKFE